MRIRYTGRQVELAPAQLRKLEAQCAKLGKMLDGKHESEAHVVLSHERHLHKAEVTVKYHDHSMVGIHENSELFAAIHGAIVKLEKQTVKVKAKWRDSKRTPTKGTAAAEPAAKSAAKTKAAAVKTVRRTAAKEPAKKVRRVGDHEQRKPMTVDEAIIEMEAGHPYIAYRNVDTGSLNVLVRRQDGHFDLLED